MHYKVYELHYVTNDWKIQYNGKELPTTYSIAQKPVLGSVGTRLHCFKSTMVSTLLQQTVTNVSCLFCCKVYFWTLKHRKSQTMCLTANNGWLNLEKTKKANCKSVGFICNPFVNVKMLNCSSCSLSFSALCFSSFCLFSWSGTNKSIFDGVFFFSIILTFLTPVWLKWKIK